MTPAGDGVGLDKNVVSVTSLANRVVLTGYEIYSWDNRVHPAEEDHVASHDPTAWQDRWYVYNIPSLVVIEHRTCSIEAYNMTESIFQELRSFFPGISAFLRRLSLRSPW